MTLSLSAQALSRSTPVSIWARLPVVNRNTVDLLAQVTIQVADEGFHDLPLVVRNRSQVEVAKSQLDR